MNFSELARPEVLTQPVYEPGKPVEAVAREFGTDVSEILKLASNENPLGPSPLAISAATQAVTTANFYPDGGCTLLRERLAQKLKLDPASFIVGNGSNEVMVLLANTFLKPGDEAVMGRHAFIAFKLAVLQQGAKPVEVEMPDLRHDLNALRDAVTQNTRIVYLPNPNNPTGDFSQASEVIAFARDLPDHVILCYDEAYAEYLENPPDLRPLIAEERPVLCCRTFSKIYGLAAHRIGYGYGPVSLIALVNRMRQPFNVNSIAQAAAIAALGDDAFVTRSRKVNEAGLKQLGEGLQQLDIRFQPSAGNFLLVEAAQPAALFERLQRDGIIIRPVGGYGLKHHVRISVGTAEQNTRLLNTLENLLGTSDAGLLRNQTSSV